MENNIECKECEKVFGSDQGLVDHNRSKHPERIQKQTNTNQKNIMKKIKLWAIPAFVIIALAVGVFFLLNKGVLPPTEVKGHVEMSPMSHVSTTPMGDTVQKHMLEHSDGDGAPGVIINYNCEEYDCPDDLIATLASFADEYTNVYVAPYPNMAVMIAVTRYGKILTLDAYDGQAITDFILNK